MQATHNISEERAFDLIFSNQEIDSVYIQGKIDITNLKNYEFDKAITIKNSIVEDFQAISKVFKQNVKFVNTEFLNCELTFSYFLAGFVFENCKFNKYLDFQCGCHNEIGKTVVIRNCIFDEFVNFFDCIYTGDIIVERNQFIKGTNLLSKNLFISFESEKIIRDNMGKLDFENEIGE